MNTPTNIIYKAKSNNGLWYKGYYVRTDNGHIIIEPGADIDDEDNIHYINPNTLCIGCVIDGKEYFAGDKVRVRGTKNTGIYETEIIWTGTMFRFLENKTYINDGFLLPSLIIEITGNIHD